MILQYLSSFLLGTVTNRDEWVYDFSEDDLATKVRFFEGFLKRKKLDGINPIEKFR